MPTGKAVKAAFNEMRGIDNRAIAGLLNGSGYQNFESVAASGTAGPILSQATKMTMYDSTSTTAKNELYEIMDAFFINMINVARAKDLTADYRLMARYYAEYEYTARRLAIYPLKGTTPLFHGVPANGVNMQAFRTAKMSERQHSPNWNYQNYDSWQGYQVKKAVDGAGAVGRLYAAMLEGMVNDRNLTFTRAFKEVINTDMGMGATGLKSSQTITVPGAALDENGKYTTEYALSVIGELQDLFAEFEATDVSDKWNNDPQGFETVQEMDNLVLLVRPQLLAAIRRAPATIYHAGRYDLPIQPIPWSDFGGREAYADAEFTTRLYPATDALNGSVIGWATEEGQHTAIETPVYWKDNNAQMDFLLYDFNRYNFISHNTLTMAPAPFNVAGAYITHWLNEIEGDLFSDYIFTAIRGIHAAA